MQGRNWRQSLWDLLIFGIGIAIVFPVDVITQHLRVWFNYGVAGHNYEVVCKDFSEGWVGMAFSAGMIVLLFIGIAVLFFTRPKSETDNSHTLEDTKTNLRLQILEQSSIETNRRLDRMESMLDELLKRELN